MSWIIDIIALAIIVLCIIVSAKKGFVKTIVEFVGFIAAIIVAFTVSTPLAGTFYDKMIEPPLIDAVCEQAEDKSVEAVDSTWGELPDFLTESTEKFGLSTELLSDSINENLSEGLASAVETTSENLIRPIFVKLAGLVIGIVLFLVLLIIVKILSTVINKLFSFSIVGKLNRSLGGVIGVLKGLVYALIFCAVISLIVSFSENGFLIFNTESVAQSFTYGVFTKIFPFELLK